MKNTYKSKKTIGLFPLASLLLLLINSTQPALSFNYTKKLRSIFSSFIPETKDQSTTQIGFFSIIGDLLEARPIVQKLWKVAENPNIKGLIIHIESCGGMIGTSQLIFSEIKKLKKIKPVVIFIENYCCSGAYYVASAADFIFALPSAELGGIGVISTIRKYKDTKFKKDQISGKMDTVILRTGTYKDCANPYTPLEEDQVKYIKEKAQKKHDQFVADIAQARNIAIEDEKIWADGKDFIGTDALKFGLINAIGDFSDAKEKMKELLEKQEIKGKLELIEIKITT